MRPDAARFSGMIHLLRERTKKEPDPGIRFSGNRFRKLHQNKLFIF